MFGIGWGLAGYCPGPALVSIAAGIDSAVVFGVAMLAGIALHRLTSGPHRVRRVARKAETGRQAAPKRWPGPTNRGRRRPTRS